MKLKEWLIDERIYFAQNIVELRHCTPKTKTHPDGAIETTISVFTWQCRTSVGGGNSMVVLPLVEFSSNITFFLLTVWYF